MLILLIQVNANVCIADLCVFLQKKYNIIKSNLNLHRE